MEASRHMTIYGNEKSDHDQIRKCLESCFDMTHRDSYRENNEATPLLPSRIV